MDDKPAVHDCARLRVVLSNSSWFAASLLPQEGSNVYATLTSTVAMLVVTTCSLFHVLFPTVGKAALAYTLSSWVWSHTDNNVAPRRVLHVCVCVCKPLSWMEPSCSAWESVLQPFVSATFVHYSSLWHFPIVVHLLPTACSCFVDLTVPGNTYA